MDRSNILRLVLIGLVVYLAITLVPKWFGFGGEQGAKVFQPLAAETSLAPPTREQEDVCDLQGVRYKAQLSSHGASLKHFWLEGERYRFTKSGLAAKQQVHDLSPESQVILHNVGDPIDLVTTPDVELRRPLRFDWRNAGAQGDDAQVQFDAFDWKITEKSSGRCVFTYTDDRVALTRTVEVTERPFELRVTNTIKNVSDQKRKHALAAEVVTWLYEKEVESHFGRQSPLMTQTTCAGPSDIVRKSPSDFEPGDFADAGFEGGWFSSKGQPHFAAVSNFYTAQALIPQDPQPAACRMLIEERYRSDKFQKKTDDPGFGAMYRARIDFPVKELNKDESASYSMLAFLGPKERDVLASAAGGTHQLSDLVDLGYFSIIAKWLLWYLVKLYGWVGNWGVAIILMTISVRVLLFPLIWKSLQSGIAMRRLKPEMDALNEKYKDDPQGKGIATMELYKQHKVNPLGGCLPVLVQMPVWWALFQSLQTAVELYHTKFLWFPDLSERDPFFIVPIILAGTMVVQQRLMPMQMDPAQQKMMTYVMPLVFGAMMLFLPAGLSVYMLTNSLLGIGQQLAIEKWSSAQVKRTEIKVTDVASKNAAESKS